MRFIYQAPPNDDMYCRCYSAYEHSKITERFPSTAFRPAQSSNSTAASLPPDISLETVVSVFLVCAGLVLGAEELRPISWRVWAGKAEKETGGGGPFQALEKRAGFVDIRVSFLSYVWVINGLVRSFWNGFFDSVWRLTDTCTACPWRQRESSSQIGWE